MKLYRDLQPGETLQPGDERQTGNGVCVPVEAVWIGQPAPADLPGWYRRPVDAVPCEEYERLRQRLAALQALLRDLQADAPPDATPYFVRLADGRTYYGQTLEEAGRLAAEGK